MILQNSSLDSIITGAGLTSYLQFPVAVDVPALLQEYAAGRVRLNSPRPNVTDAADANPIGENPDPNGLYVVRGPTSAVAIQPVRGVIVAGASKRQEEFYGLWNLDRIHSAVAAVAADPTISGLVLQMDTPGGSVLGLRAAADALLSLQDQRPDVSVLSYAQRLNASAGMYLAAATQAFHAAPGAYVGSIGTIAALTDYTGLKEKFGITTKVYTADSTLKDLGRGPITEAHDNHMKAMVKTYSDEFKGWMQERRGVEPGSMHGQAWEARMAPAGITDSTAFVTFQEFLATALGL
jgi:ClpP class serine protease